MTRVKPILLFIRDLITEAPAIWSLARDRYCERTGGHDWTSTAYNQTLQAWGNTCRRCGTWQSHSWQPLPTTTTGSTFSITIQPFRTST